MASALPRIHESVGWPLHSCGARHAPPAECPPLGVWLIEWAAGRRYIPRQRKRTP